MTNTYQPLAQDPDGTIRLDALDHSLTSLSLYLMDLCQKATAPKDEIKNLQDRARIAATILRGIAQLGQLRKNLPSVKEAALADRTADLTPKKARTRRERQQQRKKSALRSKLPAEISPAAEETADSIAKAEGLLAIERAVSGVMTPAKKNALRNGTAVVTG